MTTHDALLAAICADPADDTARLVYADWLDENAGSVRCTSCLGYRQRWKSFPQPVETEPTEENSWGECLGCRGTGVIPDGRAARAEFVRVQIKLAKWSEPPDSDTALHDEWSGLRRRERELWQTSIWNWHDIPWGEADGIRFSYHKRGFINHLTCTGKEWLQHADSLAWHPKATTECPLCNGEDWRIVRDHIWAGSSCQHCTDTGRAPRPCPPTAQPITHVTLIGLIDNKIQREIIRMWQQEMIIHHPNQFHEELELSPIGKTFTMMMEGIWKGIKFHHEITEYV